MSRPNYRRDPGSVATVTGNDPAITKMDRKDQQCRDPNIARVEVILMQRLTCHTSTVVALDVRRDSQQ